MPSTAQRLSPDADASKPAKRLRDQLLLVMTRTERPQLGKDSMLCERSLDATPIQVADLTGFAALRRVAESVSSNATVEYWKSVPYFINFMDGYQLADRVRARTQDRRRAGQRWNPSSGRPSDSTVPRWSASATSTSATDGSGHSPPTRSAAGWWQLLWVPPSMPYFTPAGPYADASAQAMTKRLIFSSWSAAPTAIASLLSYEAERQTGRGQSADQQHADSTRGNRDPPGLRPARWTARRDVSAGAVLAAPRTSRAGRPAPARADAAQSDNLRGSRSA